VLRHHRGRLGEGTAMRLWMAALAVALWCGAAQADVSKADARQVRGVVEAQLAALARDDAERAFSYAAPGIRAQFETAQRFIAMVKRGYPMVVKPASVVFLLPTGDGDDVVQAVQMTDAAGAAWIAVYTLQRQPGGAWKISGCTVARNEGRTT
jgi:hypothetical protein